MSLYVRFLYIFALNESHIFEIFKKNEMYICFSAFTFLSLSRRVHIFFISLITCS